MRTLSLHLFAALVSLVLIGSTAAITGCGGSSGQGNETSATGLITAAEGGTLASSDGKLTLSIPAGALSQDTIISITTINNEGAVEYEFEPTGLTFSTPANVTLDFDLAQQGALQDENESALDTILSAPSVMLFLQSGSDETELIDNVVATTDEETSTVSVSFALSHFTSLMAAAGNSYYAYLSSLGTHYEGSAFKRDYDVRYLGYRGSTSYKNMSISYNVRSITVTKISFALTGAIQLTSPAEITRSDFLSQRGNTSSTRPNFICNAVGDGTVTATVQVSAVVEATFQPENKTRTYSINQSEKLTRKGKCLAPYFGLNGSLNDGGEEGTRVALVDPAGDLLVDEGGTLVSADGFDLPGYMDMTQVSLGIVSGDTLETNVLLSAVTPAATPSDVPLLSFDLLLLDPSLGAMAQALFDDAMSYLSIGAGAADTALAQSFFSWDGQTYQQDEETEFDMSIADDVVSFLIPLSDLGLDAETAASANFRALTRFETDAYADALFADEADLSF